MYVRAIALRRSFQESICFNFSDATITVAGTHFPDQAYNLTYTHDADSLTTDTMDSMVSSMATIGNTWMSLIVTVIILGIMGFLVIIGVIIPD